MTPQEQQLLMQLTQRINQTQLQEKDPDAENLLGHEIGANPDAVYILAQTVLVQDIALQQAKAQVTQLQQQLQQAQQHPAHATSFLGRLLGDHDPQPAPQPQQMQQLPQAPPYQPVPGYQAAPKYAAYPPQPQYQQPQFVPVAAGQPSFLRGAMQTAAGVAAGALAFEGVESILHGFGHGYGPGVGMSGFGMGPGMGMGGGFERPVEETVVNNYYDQPGQTGGNEHHFEGNAAQFDNPQQSGNEPHFHESADQAALGGAQFSDSNYTGNDMQPGNDFSAASDQAGYNPQTDDPSAYDTGGDTGQMDDSGSGFDDRGGSGGGSFDDGGGGFDSGGDNSGF